MSEALFSRCCCSFSINCTKVHNLGRNRIEAILGILHWGFSAHYRPKSFFLHRLWTCSVLPVSPRNQLLSLPISFYLFVRTRPFHLTWEFLDCGAADAKCCMKFCISHQRELLNALGGSVGGREGHGMVPSCISISTICTVCKILSLSVWDQPRYGPQLCYHHLSKCWCLLKSKALVLCADQYANRRLA